MGQLSETEEDSRTTAVCALSCDCRISFPASQGLEVSSRKEEMSSKREMLHRALCVYISDTLSYCDTVRVFCQSLTKWMDERNSELTKMNKETNQTDLAAVLKNTLEGLEVLSCFLEAVEELAVTSPSVFMEKKQVGIHLPAGISLEDVRVVIAAAWLICPVLLQFKRDAKALFLPKVQNVEVMACMLEQYMQTTEKICNILQTCCLEDFGPEIDKEVEVDLAVDLSEDDIERMLAHIDQLSEIRMDVSFRMVFLFQEVSCSGFMEEFKKRHERMLQFLKDLEGVAVQLDSMNKGAVISNVVSSSLGVVSGSLLIAGLVLAPFTGGTSLVLSIGGAGIGLTSGLNALVTTTVKLSVDKTEHGKANSVFQRFMDDLKSLQELLKEVASQHVAKIGLSTSEVTLEVIKIIAEMISIRSNCKSLVKAISDFRALESEEIVVSASEMVVQDIRATRNLPQVTSELAETAVAVTKAPLRALPAIGLNAFFIGLDIVFIVKDSITLSRGTETETSQLIRARCALWKSEIDSLEEIYDALDEGLKTSEEKLAILKSPF